MRRKRRRRRAPRSPSPRRARRACRSRSPRSRRWGPSPTGARTGSPPGGRCRPRGGRSRTLRCSNSVPMERCSCRCSRSAPVGTSRLLRHLHPEDRPDLVQRGQRDPRCGRSGPTSSSRWREAGDGSSFFNFSQCRDTDRPGKQPLFRQRYVD